ncbi:unnamed protein product [Agarophyton chilense]
MRLKNYLLRAVSAQNINSALLVNAHNWITTKQMSVSDPDLHDLLAQAFQAIHTTGAASYHAKRAQLLRACSDGPQRSILVREHPPVPATFDSAAPAPAKAAALVSATAPTPTAPPTSSPPDDAEREEAPRDNLLKRVRSRSFSALNGAERLQTAAKRQKLHTNIEPAIQRTGTTRTAHVHDSQPHDSEDFRPLLQAEIDAAVRESRVDRLKAPTVRYSYFTDDRRDEAVVSVEIRISVPQLARGATDGVVRVSGVTRFGFEDDASEGGAIYKKAYNRAAKRAVEAVQEVRQKIEKWCEEERSMYLEDLVASWQREDFSRQCYRAFDKAKQVILGEAGGNLYGASVWLYGSVPTGLVLCESDIDVSVSVPELFSSNKDEDAHVKKARSVAVLKYIANEMQKERMEKVFVVSQTRVPVLRYMDRETQVNVDVTLNKDRSLVLSRLLRKHMQKDRRIWELCMIVKYWAKQRKVCGVPAGHINSMGWVLMVIFFTQHLAQPRLGALFRARNGGGNHATIVQEAWRDASGGARVNAQRTHALLLDFFRVFADRFDYEHEAISINLQRRDDVLYVSEARASPPALFIEQPLQRGHNVVSYVSASSMRLVRHEMRRAYYILSSRRERSCDAFAVRHFAHHETLFARR